MSKAALRASYLSLAAKYRRDGEYRIARSMVRFAARCGRYV